ncbi:caspase-6-like isoform X2 [Diabrotica virgifera virgifera]|uniref:Caspase-6-like isoform X2 n=1 Tax=Diabrotica virgifera virgifera TaxID=50390 RepID=A0A6P7FVH2_DIAVI|nr:caspase-6-like isoform X2 [Diabrotica virgifera virgifera]
MNKECKDVILKHFVKLMANCNIHILKNHLINKGIFKEKEWGDIFETDDARHNKRMFFFSLFKKNNAWVPFLDALQESHQATIVNLLCRKGTTVFKSDSEPPEPELLLSNLEISVNNTTTPLQVQVIHSKQLFDTEEKNKKISFYSSRSKKRGRVLIINNYKFNNNNKFPYRNGALVDDANLKALFEQMGGWDLDCYHNKTALEMIMLIQKFAGEGKPDYDICCMIIMSHGGEMNNDTYIYGIDEEQQYELSITKITKFFTNENSKSWRGKPKMLFFPICRGADNQLPIKHEYRTETDSAFKNVPANTPTVANLRAEEDMLVGFSTAMGYKAHRDPYLGSWYIELLCQEFMNHAHEYSVTEILQLIDQGLRRRLSDRLTMQTAEFRNLGFKNLYLNPGLYMENGVLKHFHSDL